MAEATLEDTPTYSVASVVALFIGISLLLERGIHRLKKYLKKTGQRPLRKVLDKMTEELMLLGFISLLLTVFQTSVSKICVSPEFARHMLPCDRSQPAAEGGVLPPAEEHASWHRRRLMASGGGSACEAKGKVPFISVEGLHQLHIFIFVLAVVHVAYCFLTVCLGFLRVDHWKKWERETRTPDYHGPTVLKSRICDRSSCVATRKSFIERHASHPWAESPIFIWILCFFRQFAGQLPHDDYLTMRVAFLHQHQLSDSFNFRDYIMRSLEVDFKSVIGISWWLWAFVVLFLLLNINAWYTYFWAAFIPTLLVLIIGAKQEHIIATLALQAKRLALKDENGGKNKDPEQLKTIDNFVAGIKLSDDLFWLGKPKLLKRVIHFIIFQNSFELALFIWLLATFGYDTCFFGKKSLLWVRLVLGALTLVLASYSTLPTYALISQMGSSLKETVFNRNVMEGIHNWRAKAQARRRRAESDSESGESNMRSEPSTPDSSRQHSDSSGAPDVTKKKKLLSAVQLVTAAGHLTQTAPNVPAPMTTSATDNAGVLPPACPLERQCQRLYGKTKGSEAVKKSRISPQ